MLTEPWLLIMPVAGLLIGVLFLVFGIQSFLEHEVRAAMLSAMAFLFFTGTVILFFFLPGEIQAGLNLVTGAAALIIVGLMFFPFR
ncbi:MAG: hypothetical protein JXA25_03085 [Anaerolineales bacterium]|nr:hypothetical protein [Anaerolineales bacterium]